MTASILQRIVVLSGFALAVGNVGQAFADAITPTDPNPMFSVTDLGSSYTLQQNSSGAVQTVTSGDGSQVYAFAKSPVVQVNKITQEGDVRSWISSTILFQVGNVQYGYNLYETDGRVSNVPFSTLGPQVNSDTGWSNGSITDGNAKGQFIGTSYVFGFPAFSFPNGSLIPADFNSEGYGFYHNLNQYIAQNLGVNLTSAVKIDDNGDIIAEGTQNGKDQYFLLNLNAAPTTAPEPSAFLTLGIGAAAFCWVRRRRLSKVG